MSEQKKMYPSADGTRQFSSARLVARYDMYQRQMAATPLEPEATPASPTWFQQKAARRAENQAEMADKVRENRARRAAERQGLRLMKSRRRDPRALDYGGYALVDMNNAVVSGDVGGAGIFHMNLDEVEKYLAGE